MAYTKGDHPAKQAPAVGRVYKPEVVMRTIKQGAGNPDLDALTSYNQQAGDEYQKQQKIMLSILDIELRDSPSGVHLTD